MKKVLFIQVIVLLFSIIAKAQETKVAVFDPVGNTDVSIKEIVREEISSILVNIGGFTVLERQLIDKVLAENKFQQSGMVDDSQISEIGRLMGANMVFVTSLTEIERNYFISCKMIDVQTARIEKQKTAQTYNGTADLVNTVRIMMGAMFDKKIATAPTVSQKTTTTNTNTQKNTTTPQTQTSPKTQYTPTETGSYMSFDDFKSQLKYAKKDMLIGNSYALSSYKKHKAELAAGCVLLCVGAAGIVTGPCLGFNSKKWEADWYWLDEWTSEEGTTYPGEWYDLGDYKKSVYIPSVVITAVGGAVFVTGVGLLIASALELKTTYSLYTKGGKTACTLDIHPLISHNFQGVGLRLKF